VLFHKWGRSRHGETVALNQPATQCTYTHIMHNPLINKLINNINQ